MNLRRRRRALAEREALERLRSRVLGGIHSGRLERGARLPSYRTVASEMGLDVRAAGRLYAALAREGLVEVRGKSGVHVACTDGDRASAMADTVRWTAEVLADSWRRRIPVQDVPELLRRSVGSVSVRCACVESTGDQLFSLCHDLRRDFGLDTFPSHASGLRSSDSEWDPGRAVGDADLIVTTGFHGPAVRTVAAGSGRPVVVVRLNPQLGALVRRRLAHGDLTVICVDPAFIDRVRLALAGDRPERVRGMLADDRAAIRRLDPTTPVLISAAARAALEGVELPPALIPEHRGTIAPESAAELIEALVRLNLDTPTPAGAPPPSSRDSAAR